MEKNSNQQRYALIVAGGRGNRMNSDVPKQFLLIDGLPVLMHTINCFNRYSNDIEIVLVLPEDQFGYWRFLCEEHRFTIPHRLVAGGEVRFVSVKNGLSAIDGDGVVAIHDGVRPLVSQATIGRCFAVAAGKGNAIPVLPVVESLRRVENGSSQPVDRSRYVGIQTPQTFDLASIKKAYQQPFDPEYTDDAMVFERFGQTIHMVEGNRENIKITHSTDLILAEALMRQI